MNLTYVLMDLLKQQDQRKQQVSKFTYIMYYIFKIKGSEI